jgi:3',5'-cyclic AMP phosphodiesterase CpdA
MFTLAHLSDPHLPLPRPGPGSLGSKRFLGYLSWLRRRKAIHRPEVLAQVVDDVRAHAPDHVAITGDLCNISLPEEFRRAARWLEGLGPARDVTVVPGNHDAYVPVDPGSGFAAWRPYLDGDAAHSTFPAVRRRGPVALVGASTARPMSWVSAGGALGPDQIAAIEDRLSALGREGLFRVLLIHHPPLPEGPRRKRLRDMAPLAAAIARAGVELVLHGHTHRATLAGPRRRLGLREPRAPRRAGMLEPDPRLARRGGVAGGRDGAGPLGTDHRPARRLRDRRTGPRLSAPCARSTATSCGRRRNP